MSRETSLRWLEGMTRIRRFEEQCAESYSAGKIRGFLHLYIGEEAIAVGAMGALRPEDAVVATYREHGHALARGLSMRSVMAEMYGKKAGCSRGRGGSMHLFDAELYRAKDEVKEWMKRCPLAALTAKAKAASELSDEDVARIEAEAKAEVADAVAFAEVAEVEPPGELLWGVYRREVTP